jgi:hypothetical protein
MLIHSVPLSKKKFTQEHLELSENYYSTKVYPESYDNKYLKPRGLKFVERKIMRIEDILVMVNEDVFNNLDMKDFSRDFFITQHCSIRANGRGKNADKLCEEINSRGFELHWQPISVAKCPDDQVYRMDGRTRLEELLKAGFENVIVDYYICDTWQAYFTEAIRRNPPVVVRSPMTKEDLISHCNFYIQMGWLQKDANAIDQYVRELTDNRIKYNTLQKIICNVLYGSSFTSSVASFDEAKAEAWLKKFGYIDNEKDNGIYYKVVSASAWTKAIGSAATYLNELKESGKKVKELRIVLHTGTLEGANPVESWKGKVDSFRTGFKLVLSAIEIGFFTSTTNRNVIRLYGVIPAVGALSSEFPMDRLAMFHVGRLSKGNFYKEDDDTNSKLTELLELEEIE